MNPIEVLNNSRPVQGSAVDNGTASVSITGAQGARHFVTQIEADFSAAVATIKTITLKFAGVAVFVWRWDFSKGPFSKNFAAPWHGDYGQTVSVEIEASGTGGTTGRIGMNVATA